MEVISATDSKRYGIRFKRPATRHGGATYLLPIMLDDYVLTGWSKSQTLLAEHVGRRVIAGSKADALSSCIVPLQGTHGKGGQPGMAAPLAY